MCRSLTVAQALVVITVVLVLCQLANCADPPKVDPEAAKLVKDLGSPRFAVREAAEKKLAELGSKAKPAVAAGAKDTDAELARRCEGVLTKIRAAERKALVDGSGNWPAPAGTRFKDIVGDTKEARELFAMMTEDDRWAALADAAAENPARAAQLYADEVTRVVEAGRVFSAAVRKTEDMRAHSLRTAPPGHVALFLFLGSFQTPSKVSDPSVVAPLFQAGFYGLATGPLMRPVGKLLAAWLASRRDQMAVMSGLGAALLTGRDEALSAARQWVADPKADGPVVGTAAVVLGAHGTLKDLPLLSALRDDTRVYHAENFGKGEQVRAQVRDVAVGMSLSLRSVSLREFNFAPVKVRSVWEDSDTYRYQDVSWTHPPQARDEAHRKAWDWLDKQPGAPPKPAKAQR
jgi:hypothetical protein